jgi:hypothetical protein
MGLADRMVVIAAADRRLSLFIWNCWPLPAR